MIDKLYNLKKSQTDQVLMQKAQIQSKIDSLLAEINLTQNQINISTVNPHGAISDFTILAMHRNTMKAHISKLDSEKNRFETFRDNLQEKVIELQKETEQFAYILEEEKKEQIKRLLLAEEEASSEYMQSKYISG